MKLLNSFIIALLFFTACTTQAIEKSPADYVKEARTIMLEARGDKSLYRPALDIYDEGIDSYPENTKLLKNRANLYITLGEYSEAREDMDAIYGKGDSSTEGLLFRCMLHERLKEQIDTSISRCYQEALAAYERAESERGHPSANHVLASLFANSGEADELLSAWLDHSDPAVDEVVKEVLLDFDRSDYLNQVFP